MKFFIHAITVTGACAFVSCSAPDRTVDLGQAKQVDVSAAPQAQAGSVPAATSATPNFLYRVPEGWTERPPSNMRLADFQVGDAASGAECYVTRLTGSGGGLEANLNRWRSQMSLPAYTAEEIAALPRIPVLGIEAPLVDVTGTYSGMGGADASPDQGLLGTVAELPGASVFVKLTGPAALVEAQREAFTQFCASLQEGAGVSAPQLAGTTGALPEGHPPLPGSPQAALPEGHPPVPTAQSGLPQGHPPVAGASPAASIDPDKPTYSWTAPEDWAAAPERSMRLVTFHPGNNPEIECYVMPLTGTAGGLYANVNRWVTQMGQPALSEPEIDALPRIDIMGQPSVLVEAEGSYTDMMGAEHSGYGLLGAIREDPEESLFVKMVGPSNLVQHEKDAFIAFCRSIE